MALGFPGQSGELYEVIAKDAFLNSLGDPALRIRVLDQQPKTRIKVDMEKITDEVHRLMRRMSATEAQSRTLRRMLHASAVSIQPVQQVRTIIFIARQHTDENGLIYRHSLFSPYGSPISLVLLAANIFTKFRRGHPLRGRKIQVWYKNFAIYYQ